VAPFLPSWSKPVYHLYVLLTGNRDKLQQALTAAGIGTGIHYPMPLHLCAAYASLGYREGDLPVTERAAASVLSLPMFPTLTADAQRRVAAAALEAVGAELAMERR
jgi:dTDP-4-amino-4,6-dideoxygalactose transaminase